MGLQTSLEETKILIPGAQTSQHIYPPLNPYATSFSNSVFTPICVNGLIILLGYPFCHLECESKVGRGYFFVYLFVEEGEPMRWHTLKYQSIESKCGELI